MMAQPHLKSFAFFAALLSVISTRNTNHIKGHVTERSYMALQKEENLPDCLPEVGARTTTCIVVIPEKSQIGLLHSDRVLLFSNIFPALISLISFTVLGPFSLSVDKEQ